MSVSDLSSIQQAKLQNATSGNDIEQAELQASRADSDDGIAEAARKFESLFLKKAFNKMRKAYSVKGSGEFASKIYKERFTKQVAEIASKNGGVGLAEQIQQEWGYNPDTSSASEAPDAPMDVEAPQPWESKTDNNLPGDFQSPLNTGEISSEFGYRQHPIRDEVAFHEGTDVAAPRGTSIEASSAGRVTFAGTKGGYGKTIEIEHPGGWTTRYAHAEDMNVEEGDWVEKGQTIGQVGSTGQSTGPHLHFELRKSGRTFDPAQLLMLQNHNH
jgi:murein DD-endopeptidase MepM/ murein hydrolase activator NlpD